MALDAFIFRNEEEGFEFAGAFLGSPDFDNVTLKNICRDLHLSTGGKNQHLIYRIVSLLENPSHTRRVCQTIIENLVTREKKWLAIRTGTVHRLPQCADPTTLAVSLGENKWYGPISITDDPEASWYINPIFIAHWEVTVRAVSGEFDNIPDKPQRFQIRWLCFARLAGDTVSIHWQGFSHIDAPEDALKSRSQHKYWEYIPHLFNEIEKLTQSRFSETTFHNLILVELWDKYRRNKETYRWHDIRIRAEAGGVSLNARSTNPGGVDLDVRGIHRLANTVRRAIEWELNNNHNFVLPEPDEFDEVILRTLIQDFGALSYEFELEQLSNEKLFHGHVYFGSKPHQSSVDSFPHINLHVTYRKFLEQLGFILSQLELIRDEERNQFGQLSFL